MNMTKREFTADQVDLIKRTICKGGTDDDLQLFLYACKRTGLDPFAKQVYAVFRFDKIAGRQVMTIQTSIDGYRLIADRTGKFAPGREPRFTYDEKGSLFTATSYIKKRTDDGTWHEVSATAHYIEFVGTNKEGRPNSMWASKPHVMLAKCAESQALRRAFSNDLSGIYTTEEMDQADNVEEKINHAQITQLRCAMDLIPNGKGEKIRKGIENKYKSIDNLTQKQFVHAMDFVKKAQEEPPIEPEKPAEIEILNAATI